MPEIDLECAGQLAASAVNARDYVFFLALPDPRYTAEAVEADPDCIDDAHLLFKSAAVPDSGGKGAVDLAPSAEAIRKALTSQRTEAIAIVVASPTDATAPRRAVVAPFTLIKGARLRIDLEIDPDDPASFDDRVILEGADGYRQALGAVSQGKMHAHAPGMTTLVFEGVRAGARYTCTVDPGREGPPYRLFVDLELKPEHLLAHGG